MRRVLHVSLAWLGLSVLLLAQTDSVTNQLSYYRRVYETELQKILDEAEQQLQAWPESYTKRLSDLREEARKAGNLDGILSIDSEIKRFAASKKFPDQILATAMESVRNIQLEYRDKPREIAIDRDKRVLEFTGKYRERLISMQTDLTKANRIQDALLVNAELKRVAATPAVTAAEFTLAEEEARKRKTEEAVAAPPPVPPSPAAASSSVARAVWRPPPPPVAAAPAAAAQDPKDGELAAGFKLAEKAAGLGVAMKALPLAPTPQMRMPKVRVDIMADEREPGDSSSGGGLHGSYRYRSGNTRLVFMAGVRSTTTSEYENAKMVIQYFTRQVTSRVGGKIDPNEAQKVVTPLPKVSSKAMTIECPPFQYWSSTSKYRSLYGSSNYRSGDDFYGAIVTVFGDDGKLLFQGASINSLEKLGVDAP